MKAIAYTVFQTMKTTMNAVGSVVEAFGRS